LHNSGKRCSIPTGITDKDIVVTVIYQQLEPSAPPKTPEELGWPAGFFEQTAGSLVDDPIQRYPQGEYDQRERLE
jgi:hypothetical protein